MAIKMNATSVIGGFIGIVILFSVVAALLPTLGTATEGLGNTSGLPLAGFFAENGIIILIVMAALVVGVVAMFGLGKGHHR